VTDAALAANANSVVHTSKKSAFEIFPKRLQSVMVVFIFVVFKKLCCVMVYGLIVFNCKLFMVRK
jgi:hypothetical protein